ncbi:MAG: TylF/MycF/NovP-related O-methyltransferase [Dehalococcoidia bacterium]
MQYSEWTKSVFGVEIPTPGVMFALSFASDSVWGQKAHEALLKVELEYVEHLCSELKRTEVQGALVEFGIFEGWWINHLFEVSERLGLDRPIIGYDSFQGLSSPHPEHDDPFWEEGQYAASLEQVGKNVRLAQRPRIKLMPGFFAESLKGPDADSIGEIAYARVDCDIYEPALDCLR